MASDEMLQAIAKHVTGADNSQEFSRLKERFEGHGYMLPSAAAALGYLIAKDELDAAKEEEEEPDVYDEVVGIIKKYSYPDGPISAHTTADEIFTLIYEWLDGELAKPGSVAFPGHTRNKIDELFSLFVIEKPEA